MKEGVELAATLVLVSLALLVTGFHFYDRFQARSPTAIQIDGWEAHNEVGYWIGPRSAPMVVTEFMDFTCPFCKSLSHVTDSLRAIYPESVAVVVQHFPLGRALSTEFAVAVECAGAQDRFREMYEAIFSLNTLRPVDEWVSDAIALRGLDLEVFGQCMSQEEDVFVRIREGRRVGRETGVRATPTVWVNGHTVGARTVAEFEEVANEMGIQLGPEEAI